MVVMLPPCLVMVKVTVALEVRFPPTLTMADMFTVERVVNGPPMVFIVVSGGMTTFAVAYPVPLLVPRAAVALMELLLGAADTGIVTCKVVELVVPGVMLGEALMNEPFQPEGNTLVRLNVLAVQPVVSLFVTLTE